MAEFIPLLPEEEGNDTSWYTAGAAGIASGIIKVPEGILLSELLSEKEIVNAINKINNE